MISEILRDAISDITEYASEYPGLYGRFTPRIHEVVAAMRRLQEELAQAEEGGPHEP